MTRPSRTHRRAFGTANDLLWFLLFLAILLAILLPSLSRAREQAKRAVCASNQSGLGKGLYIYANDNQEWFPHHYYLPTFAGTAAAPEHGIQWAGTMGTHDFLSITQATTQDFSRTKSHPSRSLFLMVIAGMSTTGSYICPSSGDQDDTLRNYGQDAGNPGEMAAIPGRTRFDFSGYRNLSYGYQLPYAKKGRPTLKLDVRMAILADKGPYYAYGGEGVLGTKTTVDKRTDLQPPADWRTLEKEAIVRKSNDDWRPFNSDNHSRGEGQNVLYVDGHVELRKTPLAGVNQDNIYTIADSLNNATGALVGMVPDATQTRGPLSNTDSFIVP